MSHYRIAPSILCADVARLGAEVASVIAAGADWIHVDVMNDDDVPANLAVGHRVVQAIKRHTQRSDGTWAALDVHLMVQPVDALAERLAEAGADVISFHPQASLDIDRTLRVIRAAGCKAGLAFNPAEPIDVLDAFIDDVDLVLVTSAHPGLGARGIVEPSLRRIERVRALIDATGKDIRLQVDGGINADTIRRIADAGADTFVAGSAIFGQPDYRRAIAALHAQLSPLAQLDAGELYQAMVSARPGSIPTLAHVA